MIKTLTAALALTALASLATAAEPVKMSSAELDTVVAGCGCEPEKGNNGWGNGADGTNAGSDNGGTLLSKSANDSVDDLGIPPLNWNPTTSDGR